MNRIIVIASLVVISLTVFIIATLVFNPSKLSKESENEVSPIISKNYNLDCTGFWENNPLCVERNNAIRVLQEYEFVIKDIINIIDDENDLKYQGAKVIKNEGDKFFRDEFYFKAENKYKEALNILNEIKKASNNKIEAIRNKAIIAYNEDRLNEALNYFEELKTLTSDEEALIYITKINNREEILKLNKESKDLLKSKKFNEAKIAIFKSIGLDKDYLPTVIIKDEIIKKEKDFKFLNFINETYKSIDQLNFEDAKNSINEAKNIYPNSDEVKQAEIRLKRIEKENIVKILLQNIDNSLNKEEWANAMSYNNELININPSMADSNQTNRIKSILNFIKLADIHLGNPDRLSSKNVLEEASRNYELGQNLTNDITPKLEGKVNQVGLLINEYSKRINITFISNNETYLDIERFQSFDPFDEFTISVRPGNYTFVAKKPGVQAFRKEVKIKSTDLNLVISVNCNLSCFIN